MLKTPKHGIIYVTTTRFNQETYHENRGWRRQHNYDGCIYGSPIKMNHQIPPEANVFIIEMNNSNNKINGIGLLLNRTYLDKKYNIYSDNNYNRYVYKGHFRVSRHYLKKEHMQELRQLEDMVFKRHTHSKRGQGFMLIPKKRHRDLEELKDFFTYLFL